MTPTNEDWNNLFTLYSFWFPKDGTLAIDYDWDKEHDESKSKGVSFWFPKDGTFAIDYDWDEEHDESKSKGLITNILRIALRKVGHKITKMTSELDGNHHLSTTYYTTITEEEAREKLKLWKDWFDNPSK